VPILMLEPTKCCCHYPDARECLCSRYPPVGPDEDQDDDQRCECACHNSDEDGYTEWADRNLPAPEYV
jgi:hypothetical protein